MCPDPPDQTLAVGGFDFGREKRARCAPASHDDDDEEEEKEQEGTLQPRDRGAEAGRVAGIIDLTQALTVNCYETP